MAGFLKNILWPTDFSPEAWEALRYAELFARTFSGKITALHVAPDFMPAMYQNSLVIQKELMRRGREIKNQAREQIQLLGKKKKIAFRKIVVTEGAAAKKIVETAEKEKVDLIVMGKKGQSALEKLLIGSVANHVLRHSPAPVPPASCSQLAPAQKQPSRQKVTEFDNFLPALCTILPSGSSKQ